MGTYTSKPSTYESASTKSFASEEGDGSSVDCVAQRCIEHLASEEGMSARRVAKIAGVAKSVVQKVLRTRPSYNTHWNQGFHVLLVDPLKATLAVEVVPAS